MTLEKLSKRSASIRSISLALIFMLSTYFIFFKVPLLFSALVCTYRLGQAAVPQLRTELSTKIRALLCFSI